MADVQLTLCNVNYSRTRPPGNMRVTASFRQHQEATESKVHAHSTTTWCFQVMFSCFQGDEVLSKQSQPNECPHRILHSGLEESISSSLFFTSSTFYHPSDKKCPFSQQSPVQKLLPFLHADTWNHKPGNANWAPLQTSPSFHTAPCYYCTCHCYTQVWSLFFHHSSCPFPPWKLWSQ